MQGTIVSRKIRIVWLPGKARIGTISLFNEGLFGKGAAVERRKQVVGIPAMIRGTQVNTSAQGLPVIGKGFVLRP